MVVGSSFVKNKLLLVEMPSETVWTDEHSRTLSEVKGARFLFAGSFGAPPPPHPSFLFMSQEVSPSVEEECGSAAAAAGMTMALPASLPGKKIPFLPGRKLCFNTHTHTH